MKSTLTGRTLLIGLAALMLAGAAFAQVETFTERHGQFDKAAHADQLLLHQRWLSSQQAENVARFTVELDGAAAADIAKSQLVDGRLRVGAVAAVGLDVDFGVMDKSLGGVRPIEDGFTWTTAIHSPGASALRVHFANARLPQGSELWVYNLAGEAFGPYTGHGDFWSNTVAGDTVHVQLVSRERAGLASLLRPSFEIAEVGHLGPDFFFGAVQGLEKSFCSFNEDCVENAACSSTHSAVQDADDAVGHMLFASGPYLYICSGGLLADTDSSTNRPLFLTANHCISKGNEASSLEVFFQFTTPCNGACYDPDGVVPRTSGSSILAGNRTGDYTLLELSQPAPSGSAYLGWTSSPIAFNSGANLYRLSHPSGAPQAYSEHSVDTSSVTCSSWPRGNWIYSDDTYGATEGGSSGSPVLNSSGQVVGQLSGACGYNPSDPCDGASNSTVDGALAGYYDDVAQYLDPSTGGCTDLDGDGYCDTEDCDDFDASVNPGAAEVCDDGVDNNCNGQVDEGCGTCLPKGASCSVDADCCSFKCKGGRNKSCK